MTQPMRPGTGITQREVYKLIDKLLAGHFDSEEDLLKTLVRDLCARPEFGLLGARIWEIDETEERYTILFQYGSVGRIPEDYNVSIVDQPVFRSLAEKRVVVSMETDPLLLENGITQYAATGVGEIIKRDGLPLVRYVLAFNAAESVGELTSTMTVISSATTTALRNLSMRRQQAKLKRDLDQASEIQRSLLPDHTLEFFEYSVFGISLPDSVVGGDYFDYLTTTADDDEARSGIVISDAASKGLPAAIQALFVSGALRMGSGFQTKITSLISRLNNLIYDTFPYERFVTLCYCELTQSRNGLMLYCNAGHCSPLHYRRSVDACVALEPTGPLLGIAPHQKYRVEGVNLERGDVLVLFTDGIPEAQNEDGEQFGEKRIEDIIMAHRDESARTLATTLLEHVQTFSAHGTYSDDRTIVVIKRDRFEG